MAGKKKGEVVEVLDADKTGATRKKPASKEVAIVEQAEPGTPMALLQQAIAGNVPVETIEKLMDLQDRWEAKKAKKEFDLALAAFQAECPIIDKGEPVFEKNSDTKVRYKFAQLDEVVGQTKELLAKHGFSYTLNVIQDDKMIGVACKVTHEAGHSEVSSFSIPIGTEAYMSDPQKYGARVTFCKRYAFQNAFGIITGDQDTDATVETVTPAKPEPAKPAPAKAAQPTTTAPAKPINDGEVTKEEVEPKKFNIMEALNFIGKVTEPAMLVEAFKKSHMNPAITPAQKMTCDSAFKKRAEELGFNIETGEVLATAADIQQTFGMPDENTDNS